ncbi:MAG: recombinase zinc beta ribbon domain-containing protein [Clostridium sp.]|nr:recombinase zinc beta ribbon domain-containing protein [Clostridium sp.]MEE0768385.1 recombinase zinc beta ribbon domain-containing protein [Clostridia bacterium]
MNKYETNYIKKTCKKNRKIDTWIIKENTHEGIIERKKYNIVQEIKQRKKSQTSIKHEYLLRDLLYCGHCKRKMQYKVYKSADKQSFLYDSAGFNCSLLYKKKCKNKTYIREKDLNEIVKNEVIKRLELIEIDKTTNKLVDYYKKNDKDINKIRECKNEIEKLERRKSVLYKKKCEQYITTEEFKVEYTQAKKEIEKLENLIKKLEQDTGNKLEEIKIRKIINEFKRGKCINNDFLKEIIDKIEIYSKDRIEITFNL